ncbi:hypothetical protein VTI74DRAFT_999 [Chaetomium olivicolor]
MAAISHPPTTTTTTTTTQADPFDRLLTLEDQFYTEGYNQGLADGEVAGRTEGRQLGLERGFQKFLEAGRLQGRAIVWANRLRRPSRSHAPAVEQSPSSASTPGTAGGDDDDGGDLENGRSVEEELSETVRELPPLLLLPRKDGGRLEKHVATLYALAETESLSTENTDEAVNEFDDRLRRAQGRAKVIERVVGETGAGDRNHGDGQGHDPGAGAAAGRGEEIVDV